MPSSSPLLICGLLVLTVLTCVSGTREVLAVNGTWLNGSTGAPVLLTGTNVVMKGPPWIPAVSGDAICDSTPETGANTSCQTFNAADAAHLVALGYNHVRLGVTWAGAQPDGPATELNAVWLARLHAFLDLATKFRLAVLLDVHQDAVGSATCGEGVPMWFSELAAPADIGAPLWPLPDTLDGSCGRDDAAGWAEFAGDPDYNIKNPCCRKHNQGDWGTLSTTTHAQRTMAFLFAARGGRDHFVDFIGRLARAVDGSPAALGIELMNEPPAIERGAMYETWRAATQAVRDVSPDLAVGLADTGNAALPLGDVALRDETVSWLESRPVALFYAFHW